MKSSEESGRPDPLLLSDRPLTLLQGKDMLITAKIFNLFMVGLLGWP